MNLHSRGCKSWVEDRFSGSPTANILVTTDLSEHRQAEQLSHLEPEQRSRASRATCSCQLSCHTRSESRLDVLARGKGGRKVVRDSAYRQRLIDDLEHTFVRCGWELLCAEEGS